ncbi:type I restriction endonuclease [Crateriforma conspicua]|uniref:type I site-specific deoxyribonuclease n=1 Tax=Crateriforma conspicua TaxID=2527996 RepID=A0A5C5Y480_9PLAN|nr:hypothetical protein Pan14r_17270 [Crateriforma conspicua]
MDISPDGDTPERDDYRVIILIDRLAEAVARLNPDLSQSAVDDVVHVVANPVHPSLEQNNRQLHRLYTSDVKVEYNADDGKETIHAEIIDFRNSAGDDLLVINQFHRVRELRASCVPAASALPLTKNEVQPGSRKAGVFWHTQGRQDPFPCAAMRESGCLDF